MKRETSAIQKTGNMARLNTYCGLDGMWPVNVEQLEAVKRHGVIEPENESAPVSFQVIGVRGVTLLHKHNISEGFTVLILGSHCPTCTLSGPTTSFVR